jgi:hypothetical protein
MEDKHICKATYRCNKSYKLFVNGRIFLRPKNVKYEDFHGHKHEKQITDVIAGIRVTSIPAIDRKGLARTLTCPTLPSAHGRGPHYPWQ